MYANGSHSKNSRDVSQFSTVIKLVSPALCSVMKVHALTHCYVIFFASLREDCLPRQLPKRTHKHLPNAWSFEIQPRCEACQLSPFYTLWNCCLIDVQAHPPKRNSRIRTRTDKSARNANSEPLKIRVLACKNSILYV